MKADEVIARVESDVGVAPIGNAEAEPEDLEIVIVEHSAAVITVEVAGGRPATSYWLRLRWHVGQTQRLQASVLLSVLPEKVPDS